MARLKTTQTVRDTGSSRTHGDLIGEMVAFLSFAFLTQTKTDFQTEPAKSSLMFSTLSLTERLSLDDI
jgi:hypothetical protein